jgi:hypothetical protein
LVGNVEGGTALIPLSPEEATDGDSELWRSLSAVVFPSKCDGTDLCGVACLETTPDICGGEADGVTVSVTGASARC